MNISFSNSTLCEYYSAGVGQFYAATVAVYVLHSTGEDTLYSVFTDHLGSWKTVVNETDEQVFQQSFDAWGRHRNPQNWNSSVSSAFPFDRGYTGHQHLKYFGLINMNGRMYDAGICRFLSPDPYVQAPDFTQNFNRYSYCYNNPLNYIDPTGYIAYKKYMDALYGEGNYNYRGSARGTWGNGEGNGSITSVCFLSDMFENGSGLDGVYYNWSTGEYRSIGDQNSVVPWSYVSGIVSEYSINTELTFQGRGSIKSNGSITLNNSGEVNVFKYWEVGGAIAKFGGGNQISINETHNRIGFVPLDVGSDYGAYQMANYRANISIRGNQNKIFIGITNSNTQVSGGRVVFNASARLMVNDNVVKRKVIVDGSTRFDLPSASKISLTINGGWNVYFDSGGASVPVYHPLFWPFSLNFEDEFELK